MKKKTISGGVGRFVATVTKHLREREVQVHERRRRRKGKHLDGGGAMPRHYDAHTFQSDGAVTLNFKVPLIFGWSKHGKN